MRLRGGLVVVALALACGPKGGADSVEIEPGWECNNRRMAYELTGGFGAHITGVAATCDEAGPRVSLIRQETADSERVVKHQSVGSRTYDELWEAIDSTGWRQLTDCDYLGLDSDPRYVIIIGDHASSTQVKCAAEGSATNKKLPFPYDNIVNELDLAAGGLR
ncbi:MAG: hypothetical protein KJO07_01035 [Deltaproteobacteria bacterium]|nr:hypothetical protein [Deltaproteobacteria bacterium]